VKTRENFIQDSFDFYYDAPETAPIPCGHKCKDKQECGHACCKEIGTYVKVTCTQRDGQELEHLIILDEKSGTKPQKSNQGASKVKITRVEQEEETSDGEYLPNQRRRC